MEKNNYSGTDQILAKPVNKIPTFLTDADQERTSPKKTMKKKGPHRSQSLKDLPGSSLKGLGKTTNFKLLTILDRSLFTVSQTGSVNVFGADPKPEEAILDGPPPPVPLERAEDTGNGGNLAAAVEAGGIGTGLVLDEMGGAGAGSGEEEIGIEARGGEGGRAGRTEEG